MRSAAEGEIALRICPPQGDGLTDGLKIKVVCDSMIPFRPVAGSVRQTMLFVYHGVRRVEERRGFGKGEEMPARLFPRYCLHRRVSHQVEPRY